MFIKFLFLCSTVVAMVTLICFSSARADYDIEITPRLTVGESYEDNIYSDSTNEKSDYIFTVSPGIKIDLDSGKDGLTLDYAPTWVRYNKYGDDNDTVRHMGRLKAWKYFGQHLKFNLEESYTKTEDNIEPERDSQGIRHTRDVYERNSAQVGMNYRFGPKDHLIMGYSHELLENDDPLLEDSTEQGPFAELTWWFNIRNGMEAGYRFMRYDYDRKQGPQSEDDLDAHEANLRYIYCFDPHLKVYVRYGLSVREYRDIPVEYCVHDGIVGFENDLSPHTSLSMEAGYYEPTGDISADGGLSFAADLNRQIKRGSITIGVQRGWDEDFMDVESRGFTEYWDTHGDIKYELLKDLKANAGASYRDNKYTLETDPDDEIYEGHCGLTLEFKR